jgi:hypothetical protein
MRKLHVGERVSWPAALASQAIGVLGMRGSGKSNLGRVIAEELFAASVPFVIFDPIGNWYGIRAGRNGRPAGGIPVPIFGGDHGDLQLERASGRKVADLIIDRRLSCVLDLSHADFSENDKRRFLVEFGDRLFRRKSRESGWLTLIMEEADDYAPQSARGPILPECLGMFQRLVKRGRFKGLGAFMITQRSAAINKDLLYMVGTLVVFRSTGPRDQDAVAGWVRHNAVSDELLESLPKLRDGEAWVIAPEALGSIERVRFRRMATFDTGSTPEHGAGAKPATLADIDLPKLSKELTEAAERAKRDDPRELRRRITELEAQLRRPGPMPAPKHVTVPALRPGELKAFERAVVRVDDRVLSALKALQDFLGWSTELGNRILAARERDTDARSAKARSGGVPPGRIANGAGRPLMPSRPAPSPPGNGSGGLSASRQRILNGLAFLESIGITAAEKTQLALLVGASPTSGGYFNNLGALRTSGFVEYPAPGRISLTQAGRQTASSEGIPATTEELHEDLRGRLPAAKWRVLEALIRRYPRPVDKEELAQEVGVSATSGGYFNNLGALRSLGLIDYPSPGQVTALPVLFLNR